MFLGIINILFGVIIISPIIFPKDILEKYSHFFSWKWLGAALLFWGGLGVVGSIFNIFLLFTDTFYWLLWLVGALAALALGIIVGRSILRKILSPKMKETFERWAIVLMPYQKNIGIAAIGIGFIQLFL